MSLTKEEWEFISKEAKAIIAGLAGMLKELSGINKSLGILVELKLEEKKKEEKEDC